MSTDAPQGITITKRAMKAELLDAETEYALAVAWRDDRDEKALHRLIHAYMRLAVSMAMKFKRYSVSQQDLIQEAGIGLMKAAEKFDPDRGFRFSTYAQWWIKASIQDFVMRNWSMVRTGSTTSQKSLFFNLKRVQAKIEREAQQSDVQLDRAELDELIAQEIGVPLRDVEMMQGRMSGSDFSLNAPQASDEDTREWMDTLEDPSPQSAEVVEREHDLNKMRGWITDAMSVLSDREKYIIAQRKLMDEPRTLEGIGTELKLSKERIRQIEAVALEKLRKRLENNAGKAARALVMA
ncbi:RNA polymerase factor sigma-32 [Amylibacter sp. SFDW26]|uniref:RNA polymerase factor sigma-32 n=1 Tax=Amylibacter sp. SFDW26 TaxID=2652722 RepID=UPI00126235CB|nr:RNA polymerase factor sigma-32 [Amylibacter sp. SFDW26]KAB7613326.1 RNA polymerase factor sigma-32 [Amylibacter sp. SFDW26]